MKSEEMNVAGQTIEQCAGEPPGGGVIREKTDCRRRDHLQRWHLREVPRSRNAGDRTLVHCVMKALILSADDFEDSELLVPYSRLKEAGIEVDIASLKRGKITGKHGHQIEVDKTLAEVKPHEYDILIVPGGKAPAAIRKNDTALEIAASIFRTNKPVAAICHGPQLLISAGLLKNRRATCYQSVAQELREAGAIYEDAEVVVDGNLITSRKPSDLPAFMREIMRMLKPR